MHEKLKSSKQDAWTVRKYAHKLENLVLMVGFVSEHKKVDKLWNDLNRPNQKELWKCELNTASTTWDKVHKVAKVIEITERVGQRINHHDHE